MSRPDRNASATPPPDFIRQIVAADVANGKHDGRVVTRFPPEPNGYLHIGHAKAICLNFGIAAEYPGAACHLRYDDTNPGKESPEYVDAIERDVRWLGFDWGGNLFHASDYFEQLYGYAVRLIELGKAYVDESSAEEIRARRGTLTDPGTNGPHRDRPIAENVALFARMRAGTFPDGACVLRAKIDMASPNLTMRDPVLYRIRHQPHHRTGDRWCIYPTYDFTHPLSDAIEAVTHSLCSLEFADHRPFYDWLLETLATPNRPQQIEFARLNVGYTVLSKRRLHQLVADGHVDGWDDPRMPTLSALRRRGYPPEAIRTFCEMIGVARKDNRVDVAMLEHAVREHLNPRSPRVMAVLRPLRLVIENYPEGASEDFDAVNNPEDPAAGTRRVPFSRVLYIEEDDFQEDPPPKYFRLSPGREVRLRWACVVRCTGVVKDETGRVVEVRCTYDEASRGGNPADGRKIKATIHWVSAAHAIEAEVRLYDRLFLIDDPAGDDWLEHLNPASCERLRGCKLEPSLVAANVRERYQFERLGYFCLDEAASTPAAPVFNRTVTLRDAWARVQKAGQG
jgi:glutaminyl-tRNA synthetase